MVIRSPGVSRYRPEAERLASSGVELTTGTNLWFAEHGDERVVAVTGTKGKSTTTSLIAHLLNESGVRATLGGNVGRPLLDILHVDEEPDVWVLELSSFQLDGVEGFEPTAAARGGNYPVAIDRSVAWFQSAARMVPGSSSGSG